MPLDGEVRLKFITRLQSNIRNSNFKLSPQFFSTFAQMEGLYGQPDALAELRGIYAQYYFEDPPDSGFWTVKPELIPPEPTPEPPPQNPKVIYMRNASPRLNNKSTKINADGQSIDTEN